MFPKTPRIKVEDNYHGIKINDYYRWLEDFSSEKVQKWLDEQEKYRKRIFSRIPNREKNLKRIKELLSLGTISIPLKYGSKIFTLRRTIEDQRILYVQNGLAGELVELVNPNKLTENEPIAIDWYAPSPTGRLVAYGLSKSGDEWSTLRIIDTKTKEIQEDKIPRTRWITIVWLQDESGFYYSRYPQPGTVPEGEEFYNRHIYFHKLGTDWQLDPKIFGEGRDKTELYWIKLSDDQKYLRITISRGANSDIYLLNLEEHSLIEVIVGEDCFSESYFLDDELWIITNRNASNRCLYKTKVEKPSVQNWQLVLPEKEDILEHFLVTKDKIFCLYMKNAVNVLKVFNHKGKEVGELPLSKFSSMKGLVDTNLLSSEKRKEFFVTVKSFLNPLEIYHYDIQNKKLSLYDEIPSPINAEDYEEKQVWYESKDSTKVPMFLVHKKGIELDGNNPTMLTGYGGFNIAIKPPGYDESRFFWLEKGGILAIANIRGGSEYGKKWHQEGMLENKQNVFDDFIYAAKWLIENKYSSPKTLAIFGESNGGLLTGAAVTQKPELFSAVVIAVPVLDMLRWHLFKGMKIFTPEYGTADNPEHFQFLYKYSPYHKVKKGTDYPAIYLTTGEADTRADPSHALKMTAILQWATTSREPIVLKMERETGHGFGKSLEKICESNFDIFSFFGWKTGMLL